MDFFLDYKETHLKVSADEFDEERVREHLVSVYNELESYLTKKVFFASSIEPVDAEKDAPEMACEMSKASLLSGVGPMAAVAGGFAQEIGEFVLDAGASWVIAENGGDLYLSLDCEKTSGVGGTNLAFVLKPADTPCGVCTSSGKHGHSLSFGDADGVTVVADNAFIADAAATAIANEVKGVNAIEDGLRKAKSIDKIRGVLITKDGEIALWGKLPKLVEL